MEETPEIEVGVTEGQEQGVYANELGILIGDPDVTIDFVKAYPDLHKLGQTKRLLVARVTLPWPMVDQLVDRLKDAREMLASARRESKGKNTRAKASEGG